MKKLMVLALVLSLVGLASATSITVVNSSFELDSSGNQITGGVGDITTDSLGWNEIRTGVIDWYPHVSCDDGTTPYMPDGVGFLMLKAQGFQSPTVPDNQNSLVWQVLDGETYSEGLTYTFSFVSARNGTGNLSGDAILSYEDGTGALVDLANAIFIPTVIKGEGEWEEFSVSYTVLAGDDCIGKNIGLKFQEYWGQQWLAVDAVQLSVIPEPATMLILGLGGLFLRRRK